MKKNSNFYLDISLLIAVHLKTEVPQLNKTINSIYLQKGIPSEIIIILDGPIKKDLNNYLKNINKIKKNIIITKININKGLGFALNHGLQKSKYDIIARLDPEDEIINNRFFVQKKEFDLNSNLSICGSYIYEKFFKKNKLIKRPIDNIKIYKSLKSSNPIIHSSVMFRKKDILSVGGYPHILKCQDYLLWILCKEKKLIFKNIDKPLLKTKLDIEMMKRRNFKYFKFEQQAYKHMLKNFDISRRHYYKLIFTRLLLRILPNPIKILIYLLR